MAMIVGLALIKEVAESEVGVLKLPAASMAHNHVLGCTDSPAAMISAVKLAYERGLVHRFDEIDHMGVGFIFAETTCSLTA
jgi:hypothetical protein